ISGGGRANFTNLTVTADNYISENPHFARSALARYTPRDFIALVQKHNIAFHEKTLGQLFCDGSAQQIVTMLETEARAAGVETHTEVTIHSVAATPSALRRFTVATTLGDIACDSVIVATGGLSIPKMGATGLGYEIARSFGHRIVEPRPALVPLTFSAADRDTWCDLSGLSTEVIATPADLTKRRNAKPIAFREKLLVTHRGISGPAALQISSYWKPGASLHFDLAPKGDVFSSLLNASSGRHWNAAYAALRMVLPARFAERWISLHAEQHTDWTNQGITQLEADLHAWQLTPAGTEGFDKAEATAGGIDTRDLSSKTMEATKVPGLFAIGEAVDVTGWLGGYNFQWAWASAVAAGSTA
ncbi:MAG: aminoacetone oxidase family FAD-binding enzyme, partial [Bryocella sp.]